MASTSGTSGNDYIDIAQRLGIGVAGVAYAGAGTDRVVGGTGADTLYGEDGNDQLSGNGGNDSLVGGEGNDQMSGGADNDTLDGGNGNDTMGGDAGDDSLIGGAGMDALIGGDGNDTLDGGDDVDSLSGNNGNDLIFAGAGDDRSNGGAGNDTIYGGIGADTIDGNLDNDLIYGEDGNDTLLGGDGNDTVDGGADNDIVMGAAGDDSLSGGDGADTIEGSLGRDTIFGGSGDDLVRQSVAAAPANGLDELDGGGGTDTLVVNLTLAQWQNAGIKADLAGLSDSFASAAGQFQAYTATSLGLSAVAFEKLVVSVDGNYAPTAIALSGTTVAENAAAGVVGTLTTDDATVGDTFTYTVDDSRFEVVDGMLKLKAGESLNYEQASSVALNITTTDSSGISIGRAFTVNVADVNEAPTDIALSSNSVAENLVAGTIGTLTTTDPDAGGSFTYSLVGNPGGNFAISGNTLSLAAGKSLDYETLSSYSVTVRTTDQDGLFFDKALTINVANVNEAPTNIALSNNSVAENAVAGFIGTLTTTDPDVGNSFTYSLVGNPGSNFAISGNTLSLAAGKALNYEAQNSYSVTVRTTDQGGLFFDKALTINVTDVNEAPILTSLIPDKVVTQNAAFTAFSVAGNFSDPDGTTPTYSLVSGSAAGVTFNAATGTFSGTPTALGSYTFTVQASDGTFSVQDTFRLSVVTGLTAAPTSQADRFDFRGTTTPLTLNLLSGNDTVFGGSGDNNFNGDAGTDYLFGGDGNDTLTGGAGDDILIGGTGNDLMADGNGNADVFLFIGGNNGVDRITGLSDKNFIAFGTDTGVTALANFTRVVVGADTKISWSNAQSSGDVTLVGYTGTVKFAYSYDVSPLG